MATFTCPTGTICGDQARTFVGRTVDKSGRRTVVTNPGTGIYHRTSTKVIQDTSGKVSGAETVVYIEKNGTWQPAAITKDGGKTFQYSDPNYPTMAGVAGANLQNELTDQNGAIRKNVNAQTQKAATNAGVPPAQIPAVVASTSNQAGADPNNSGNAGQGGTQGGASTLTPAEQEQLRNAVTTSTGRKTYPGAGGTNPLVYPEALRRSGEYPQDYMKFSMLEYKPRGVGGSGNTGGSFGVVPSRSNAVGDRQIIGTVILPVPGGIRDQNTVDWSGTGLDPVEAELTNIASGAITGGVAGAESAVSSTSAGITNNPDSTKAFVANKFIQAATGVNALQRQYGAIANNNLELLFNGPQLRTFSFVFKMYPRSPEEAKIVRSIIRLFKQGMSSKKSEGELFIKSPHTFMVGYYQGSSLQPYLNKIKECAITSLSVDYTPDGNYATYKDGSMTAYQMSMTLQELEPVFDNDYGNDNDSIGY